MTSNRIKNKLERVNTHSRKFVELARSGNLEGKAIDIKSERKRVESSLLLYANSIVRLHGEKRRFFHILGLPINLEDKSGKISGLLYKSDFSQPEIPKREELSAQIDKGLLKSFIKSTYKEINEKDFALSKKIVFILSNRDSHQKQDILKEKRKVLETVRKDVHVKIGKILEKSIKDQEKLVIS